jgi:hypothetical protein
LLKVDVSIFCISSIWKSLAIVLVSKDLDEALPHWPQKLA